MAQFFLEEKIPNKPSLLRRFTAFLIDCAVSLAVAAVIYYFWLEVAFSRYGNLDQTEFGRILIQKTQNYSPQSVILTLAFCFIFFRDLIGGRSLGKKILKLIIVHKTSCNNARYARTFLRSMIPFTALICFVLLFFKSEYMIIMLISIVLLDLVLISTQKNHRSLGDFLADTIVMIERRSKDRPRKKS